METDRIKVDMSSTLTSVHRKFVVEAQTTGHTVMMRNTEEQQRYPIAVMQIQMDGQVYTRELAVASRLPEDVLLGTDVPLTHHFLLSLDKGECQEARELLEALSKEKSLVAVTRAQAKQQQERANGYLHAHIVTTWVRAHQS